MSCDVGKTAEGLENELWRRLRLILQPLHRFTYVTAHSPTLTSLHICHSSFSNPSAALPTSQLILQPFRCFTYVIGTSPMSPGEPPMSLWCLIHPRWFCNLQWLRPAGLYERCKLALELKRLKTPAVGGGIEGGGCTCCLCNVILTKPHWVHDCRCLLHIDLCYPFSPSPRFWVEQRTLNWTTEIQMSMDCSSLMNYELLIDILTRRWIK